VAPAFPQNAGHNPTGTIGALTYWSAQANHEAVSQIAGPARSRVAAPASHRPKGRPKEDDHENNLAARGVAGPVARAGIDPNGGRADQRRKNTDNVTTHSMGYDRKSYSPLKEINKSNVKRLVPIWSTSLMNDSGELAAPTIYNGVMYVDQGVDIPRSMSRPAKPIWRTSVEFEPERCASRQFGAINRGRARDLQRQAVRVSVTII